MPSKAGSRSLPVWSVRLRTRLPHHRWIPINCNEIGQVISRSAFLVTCGGAFSGRSLPPAPLGKSGAGLAGGRAIQRRIVGSRRPKDAVGEARVPDTDLTNPQTGACHINDGPPCLLSANTRRVWCVMPLL